ncbi:SDH family Clp fold serine proteinase [Pedobacter boryungensis]|uniref:Serine dehydrogenase proteinase n=1 Tax=Pedobacter boryungensis TaxID=869962 RepID=A0ABX2DB87_9SPHI|nr:hypothetical protein [Pedobacter boryungensis]NQX31272.1 hypothetical protein [Pedobacter boryungensis]
MEELFSLIKNISTYRKNVPQFLFMAGVDSKSMKKLRVEVLKFKKDSPDIEEIDFILQSGGGLADEAYRIIRTLRNNFKTVNIIVPFWAKSAATLIALGGSRIIMDEFGEFGPLDAQIASEREDGPQYDRESALNDENSIDRIETKYKELFQSMFKMVYESDEINIHKNELSKQLLESSVKFYEPLLNQINPYRLGEKRRILNIGKDYAEKILIQFNPQVGRERCEYLVDYLVNRCSDHGFIIDYKTMSMFMPKVIIKTDEIGSEYRAAVSELTSFFLENDCEHIGFIETITVEEKLEEIKEEMSKPGAIAIVSETIKENLPKVIKKKSN